MPGDGAEFLPLPFPFPAPAPAAIPCWEMLARATQVKEFPRLNEASRGRAGTGNHLLFFTDSGHCTLWEQISLGWFCAFPPRAEVLKGGGSTGWCQGFSAIRWRFMVLFPSQPTGLGKERFPGLYQLKSVARAVVLGTQWCGNAFSSIDRTSDSTGPQDKEQSVFLTQLQRQKVDLRMSGAAWDAGGSLRDLLCFSACS